MTGELLRAARRTQNGHHGLHERTVRRGVQITIFGDPAAPMLVCVIGEEPIPLDEFGSFTIAVDQPDELIRRTFRSEIAKYTDEMPTPERR